MSGPLRQALRLLALLGITFVALQATFAARVALMAWANPSSTTFERSEMWRLSQQHDAIPWAHQWVPGERISPNLKRAVVAAEDSGFADHAGVEWDAIERAWERNQRAAERAEKAVPKNAVAAAKAGATARSARSQPRVLGGSTITQQLAKNLFLSGERSTLRKAQELAITYALEALLDKRRILEIYLNHVEWGEGVFGAQMAARHHHRVDASALSPMQAARLAVLLPAPKRFEKRPQSPYLQGRAAAVLASMAAVEVP